MKSKFKRFARYAKEFLSVNFTDRKNEGGTAVFRPLRKIVFFIQ
ncbi:hypothetical protein [Lactococcus lactis]|nr:hypothetical protein [Lactococcus lactis]